MLLASGLALLGAGCHTNLGGDCEPIASGYDGNYQQACVPFRETHTILPSKALQCPGGFVQSGDFCKHEPSAQFISGWVIFRLGNRRTRLDLLAENKHDNCEPPHCEWTNIKVFTAPSADSTDWEYRETWRLDKNSAPLRRFRVDRAVLIARGEGGPKRPDPRLYFFGPDTEAGQRVLAGGR